jgi:hypothetical protein
MTPIESDGVYAGIPYRVLPDSSIEAMLPVGLVKFKNIDQFLAATANAPAITSESRSIMSRDVLENKNRQKTNVPASARPLDYYSILLEAIHKAEHNSAQLRALVYERARFNLKREFLFGYSSLGLSEVVQHVNDFELAVARIEANVVDVKPSPAYREQVEPREIDHSSSGGAVQIMPPTAAPPIYEDFPSYKWADNRKLDRRSIEAGTYLRAATLLLGSLLVAIVFVGAMIAGALWHSPKEPSQIEIAHKSPATGDTSVSGSNSDEDSAKPAKNSSEVPFPLPTSFGIYALSDNKLTKLEALPIRVPDPRVTLSAEITKPSITIISGNKLAFILFRRDLLNNAPEKVTLRVVARVARETKFVGGKATIINFERAWRVRNTSLEYKVSPIVGQPEMVIAQTDDNQSLAAGRYALVLNGIGYDFTIEGGIQSPAHCLEGFQASNGTVYSECRKVPSGGHASSGL